MSRIKHQTDNWGGVGETHLEVEWQGTTLFITISDDRIKVHASHGLEPRHPSVNVVEITPDPKGLTWKAPE